MAQDDFAVRLQSWLEANATRRADTAGMSVYAVPIEQQQVFQASLYDAGFAGITWPREYGGQGLTNAEQITFTTVARDYDLPVGAFSIGLGMPGPTILELGTEAQKQRYLPKVLRGEEIWCQLFSEPSGGSDVASLQTSAVRDGDAWVINGQKVWTSGAQYSDFGALLARTDPTVPKHQGITMFIVDMHAPGVTVRPLKVATGESPFNEVFFDDVRIPADAIIGEHNKGWDAAVVMLRNERISIGSNAPANTNPLSFASLRELAIDLGRNGDIGVRRDLSELYAQQSATRLFGQLLREEGMRGKPAGARGSIGKLAGSQLNLSAAEIAKQILGPLIASTDSERISAITSSIVGATGSSIAGGTHEIQRNIIGERVLGLAKDPGVNRSTPFNQLRVGTQSRQGER
jgi:alkylation response protein AidB-like acyl-CoA dehydrogenase